MIDRPVRKVARGLCPPFLWASASRIYKKLKTKPELKRIHGVEILLPPSHLLPGAVASQPFYDTLLPEFLLFLRDELRVKLLVADVGANVGDTAALSAARVGSGNIRFICLEADEQYLPYLTQNTINIDAEIICAVLDDASRESYVELRQSHTGTGYLVAGSQATKVLTLDHILSGRTPHLIKIDTDGYDNRILRGSAQCLKNTGPHLFFEYSPYHIRKHGGEEPTAIFSFLRELEYTTMIVYDSSGYPICFVELDNPALGTILQYADFKPMFYFDLLVSRSRDLLARFYQSDRKRFPLSQTWVW